MLGYNSKESINQMLLAHFELQIGNEIFEKLIFLLGFEQKHSLLWRIFRNIFLGKKNQHFCVCFIHGITRGWVSFDTSGNFSIWSEDTGRDAFKYGGNRERLFHTKV